MLNKILHALSNSAGPFQSPLFVPQPGFIPAVLSADAQNLRTALMLNTRGTDYYLKIYLGILSGYPDLKSQFNDTHTSYEVTDFLPRGVRIDGGDFLSAPNIDGVFTDPPNPVLPINLTYLIDYQDEELLRITLKEQGNSVLVNYQILGPNITEFEDEFPSLLTNGGGQRVTESGTPRESEDNATVLTSYSAPITGRLAIDWPTSIPFLGQINLTQNWTLNSRVQISVEPSHFPYALILQSAERWPYLNTLLLNYGMLDAYAYSVEVTEKLAIILTLIGLDNPAIQL